MMMEVERYDMVLLDLMMPEMDGYAVLSTIKTEQRWRDTPVIMVSAAMTHATFSAVLPAAPMIT